jgi:hypothetical protein
MVDTEGVSSRRTSGGRRGLTEEGMKAIARMLENVWKRAVDGADVNAEVRARSHNRLGVSLIQAFLWLRKTLLKVMRHTDIFLPLVKANP